MNNICDIEANPASGYSGTEPYVSGRMDARTDDTRHTITTDFRRAYKKQ